MSFNLWAVYMETVSIVTHVRYQMRSQVLGFWAPKRRMRSTTSFLLHPRPNTGLEETKWFLLFLDVSLDKRPKQWQNVWGFCILHVVLTGQQLCPCSCVRVFHQAYAHLSLYTVLHPYTRSLTHRQEIKMETIDKMEIAFWWHLIGCENVIFLNFPYSNFISRWLATTSRFTECAQLLIDKRPVHFQHTNGDILSLWHYARLSGTIDKGSWNNQLFHVFISHWRQAARSSFWSTLFVCLLRSLLSWQQHGYRQLQIASVVKLSVRIYGL